MAHGEALKGLVCSFFLAEMFAEHLAIEIHLLILETVYSTYVKSIDADSTAEITKVFQNNTGQICVRFDGATVLRKFSKGNVVNPPGSIFIPLPTLFLASLFDLVC